TIHWTNDPFYLHFTIRLYNASGGWSLVIASNLLGNGSYPWKVPSALMTGQYHVVISWAGDYNTYASISGESATFSILTAIPAPIPAPRIPPATDYTLAIVLVGVGNIVVTFAVAIMMYRRTRGMVSSKI
nr:hypothetical protein [Candidatus Sigynarchaeota archaeon]